MGEFLVDQYSLLHFAMGIVVYFWGMPFMLWLLLHIIFEFVENTKMGVNIINKWLTIWPGGKPKPDSKINIIGDILFGMFGWFLAYLCDYYGKQYGLNPVKHH